MKIDIKKHEAETILGWIEGEKKMKEWQFTNKKHYLDYMRRIKGIETKLKKVEK